MKWLCSIIFICHLIFQGHLLDIPNYSIFHDELDLLSQFLNDGLADKVMPNKPMMIIGGSSDIDEEYAKDFYLPMNFGSEKE